MDIDITRLATETETWDLSGSIATQGPGAARQTWQNAMAEASAGALLTTPEALDAMRDWIKDTGAWDKAQRDAMTDQELNALFLQLVTGNLREMGLEDSTPDEFDWGEYEQCVSSGALSGNIYQSADGKIYYYLGS